MRFSWTAYQNGKYTKEPPLALANELGVLLLTTPTYRVEHTARAQYADFLAASRTEIIPMRMTVFGSCALS